LDRHLKDSYNIRKQKERQLILEYYTGLILARLEDILSPPANIALFEALGKLISVY
jgi:hypothetical protein